jgi:DNA-binding transcriptional LysR family regulator
MLDSHQLNVFLIAAETLNFTQAAQRLHMSQPSVSQHIQSLERHFNAELFTRSGRNLQLTDAGIALVPMAREMVRHSVNIEETMASLQGKVYGHLTVGCSTTPGKYVLPQLLARFHHKYPQVKITCQVTSQVNAVKKLCDGDIHFALSSQITETCREIETIKFICEEIVLIVPLNHPWAERGEIEPEELYDADFIFREEESGTYMVVRDALDKLGISVNQLETLLTLGNSEAIALSVQEELGVGFVSSTVVEKLGQGKVVPIKIRNLNICHDIYFGRHAHRPATKAQTVFWDFISSLPIPIIDQDIAEVLANTTSS